MRFAIFLSDGFTTMAVINQPEKETGKTHLCALVQVNKLHPSSVERFSEILMRKPRNASFFSLECTDFKNVIFEKIPWTPSEDAEVAKSNDLEIQNNKNSKYKTDNN